MKHCKGRYLLPMVEVLAWLLV